MSVPEQFLAAAARRTAANAEIRRLSKELNKAVKRALVYEPGELVEIPSPQGPVVMEILRKAEGYGDYEVRLLRDGSVITQQARYFEPHKPAG